MTGREIRRKIVIGGTRAREKRKKKREFSTLHRVKVLYLRHSSHEKMVRETRGEKGGVRASRNGMAEAPALREVRNRLGGFF